MSLLRALPPRQRRQKQSAALHLLENNGMDIEQQQQSRRRLHRICDDLVFILNLPTRKKVVTVLLLVLAALLVSSYQQHNVFVSKEVPLPLPSDESAISRQANKIANEQTKAAIETAPPPPIVQRKDAIMSRAEWGNPIVLEEYRLIFFTIPKVACSEWKQLFRRMMGFEGELEFAFQCFSLAGWVHAYAHHIMPMPSTRLTSSHEILASSLNKYCITALKIYVDPWNMILQKMD